MSDTMNNIAPTEPVKTETVMLPAPLQDDPAPKLGTHLDAAGHDIVHAGNIECDSINGTPLTQSLAAAAQEAQAAGDARYAAKVHTHPEFSKIEGLIDQKIAEAAPQEEYALKNHTHPATVTPLTALERGSEVKKLLDTELCPFQHSHPNLDAAVLQLQEQIKSLQTQLDATAKQEIVDEMHNAVVSDIGITKEVLSTKIDKVAKSVPALPPESYELTGARYCLVPFKCATKKLADMLVVDYDGRPVDLDVTCKGSPISLGQTFSAGEVLTIPNNCLALFKFN